MRAYSRLRWLGVALVIAAIGGVLLIGVIGTARIVQLRRHVRRAR